MLSINVGLHSECLVLKKVFLSVVSGVNGLVSKFGCL